MNEQNTQIKEKGILTGERQWITEEEIMQLGKLFSTITMIILLLFGQASSMNTKINTKMNRWNDKKGSCKVTFCQLLIN